MTRPDADAERQNWTIEKLVPGGDGMAHLADGRVAFASGAFPGDVIRPLSVEARKGHVRAARWEIVQPSPDRVVPPCKVEKECGGCDFMAVGRPSQVANKEALLREALTRTGGFSVPEGALTVTSVGPPVGYRSRVRFHVDAAGKVGFFARGSHALVVIPSCPVCAVEINEALQAIRRAPADALAAFSEVEIRRADAAPAVSVRLVPRIPGGAAPALRRVRPSLPRDWILTVADDEEAPRAGGRSPPGKAAVRQAPAEAVAARELEQTFPLPLGATLRAAPGVFTQVNWAVNLALVEAVVDGARAHQAARFLDAYAGAGNFSLPLLAAGLRGVSVERDPRAVACARTAARESGFPEDGFVVGEAAKVLAGLAQKRERFDLVLLDPPRSGALEALASVVKLSPRLIAICSCDPVTLARDLSTLARAGYTLGEVRGFDMFPQTHHLEALAWMTREESGPRP